MNRICKYIKGFSIVSCVNDSSVTYLLRIVLNLRFDVFLDKSQEEIVIIISEKCI
jgi:hypothetical protein